MTASLNINYWRNFDMWFTVNLLMEAKIMIASTLVPLSLILYRWIRAKRSGLRTISIATYIACIFYVIIQTSYLSPFSYYALRACSGLPLVIMIWITGLYFLRRYGFLGTSIEISMTQLQIESQLKTLLLKYNGTGIRVYLFHAYNQHIPTIVRCIFQYFNRFPFPVVLENYPGILFQSWFELLQEHAAFFVCTDALTLNDHGLKQILIQQNVKTAAILRLHNPHNTLIGFIQVDNVQDVNSTTFTSDVQMIETLLINHE